MRSDSREKAATAKRLQNPPTSCSGRGAATTTKKFPSMVVDNSAGLVKANRIDAAAAAQPPPPPPPSPKSTIIPLYRGLRQSKHKRSSLSSSSSRSSGGNGGHLVLVHTEPVFRGLGKNSIATITRNQDSEPFQQQPGAISVGGGGGGGADGGGEGLLHGEELHCESEVPGADVRTSSVLVNQPPPPLVTAVTVDEEEMENSKAQLEEDIRQRILQEAVEADVIPVEEAAPKKPAPSNKPRRKSQIWALCACMAMVALVAIATTLMVTNKKDDPPGSSSSAQQEMNDINGPTIEAVRERGYLRCGLYARNGEVEGIKYLYDQNEEIEGLNMDQCRAVAMAVFGDSNPNRTEPMIVTPQNRFLMLANGSIDLLSNTVTHTMSRDVFDSQSQSGFSFSTPYFYSGMSFGGVPFFVNCAERRDTFQGKCRDLRVCATPDTTHYSIVKDLLGESAIVASLSAQQQADFLRDGSCNVIASEPISMPKSYTTVKYGYSLPFHASSELLSKEPLSLVTRQNDPEWSSLVDLVVNMFFLAEANHITQANAESMASLFVDDPEMSTIAVSIIAEFGNYGELYHKHLEDLVPRSGLNNIYTKGHQTGLMYSFPFGYLDTQGPDPIPNMTLQVILDREYLLCGVIPRPGFAVLESNDDDDGWSGFDVQFCRGIAAAVFANPDQVEFVNVTQDPVRAYGALAAGEVDTVAGLPVTLQAKYREPTTGEAFAFSLPTFYDNEAGVAYAFATNKLNHQWSDFVSWVISGIVYAEEEGIAQNSSDEMPRTRLFGDDLKHMFRDALDAVGSYGEIYNHTLEEFRPRSGGNLLNNDWLGPQHYPLPVS